MITSLKRYPDAQRYIVALSGGLDSHVLLHLVSTAAEAMDALVVAIHINHNLCSENNDWSTFCFRLCREYRIECKTRYITEPRFPGSSVEAWAREHRYRLIADEMEDGDILLTAHHADDQAETVLLQLLRGSGPRGLAAMAELRPFHKGWHARPLLHYSRQQLAKYAEHERLKYIADHSNEDIRYNRNFLRKKIIPLLKKRWPSMHTTLSRTAVHQRSFSTLIDDIADDDLRFVKKKKQTINIDKLLKLHRQRQINVILYWLRSLNLPQPDTKHIDELIDCIIYSDSSRTPCISWRGAEVRRYRNQMYAAAPLLAHDTDLCLDWSMQTPLDLPLGRLIAVKAHGSGLAARLCKGRVQVRFRKGGEKIRPYKRAHSITVKHFFQDCDIIPWFRSLVPMLYIDGRLAAIPSLCVANHFVAKKDEAAWVITWDQYNNVVQEK